ISSSTSARKRLLRASGSRRIARPSVFALPRILGRTVLLAGLGLRLVAEFERHVEAVVVRARILLDVALETRVLEHGRLAQALGELGRVVAEPLHVDLRLLVDGDAFEVGVVWQAVGEIG